MAESCDLRGISTIMTDFFDDPGSARPHGVRDGGGVSFARPRLSGADIMGVVMQPRRLSGPALPEFVRENEKKSLTPCTMGVPVRLHICGDITAPGMIAELKPDILDLDSMVSVRQQGKGGPDVLLAGTSILGDPQEGTPRIVTRS